MELKQKLYGFLVIANCLEEKLQDGKSVLGNFIDDEIETKIRTKFCALITQNGLRKHTKTKGKLTNFLEEHLQKSDLIFLTAYTFNLHKKKNFTTFIILEMANMNEISRNLEKPFM